jgi:uncharacterized protein (DUF2344 family)
MQYIKHYYVDDINNNFITTIDEKENSREYRQPNVEYSELNVKFWLTDSDSIDLCISEIPDDVLVENIRNIDDTKYSVKILTKEEYDSFVELKKEVDLLNSITIKEEIVNQVKITKNNDLVEFINS